jgi:hypothetical protein
MLTSSEKPRKNGRKVATALGPADGRWEGEEETEQRRAEERVTGTEGLGG